MSVSLESRCLFYLTAVYAPVLCEERRTFLQEMSSIIPQTDNSIVCGDFNAVKDVRKDRLSQVGTVPRTASTTNLRSFVCQMNLVDIFRERHPDQPGFTWGQAHHQLAERIDMFFVTPSLSPDVDQIRTQPCVCSDHNSVTISVNVLNGPVRGSGYWRMIIDGA